MVNKQAFKSIVWGVLDFILAIPLLLMIGYSYIVLNYICKIPEKETYLIFYVIIGIIFVKLIIDAVCRRDKELKNFWAEFISAYILIMLIEVFLILFEIKTVSLWRILPSTLFYTLIFLFYVFLIRRIIKIERETYKSKIEFLGFWVILPFVIFLVLLYFVPPIQ